MPVESHQGSLLMQTDEAAGRITRARQAISACTAAHVISSDRRGR